MTKFLLRHFIKDWDKPENPAVRSRVGKLAGITGILCNCILFLCKLLVGTITGAVSIIADAANNLSDAASSVVTLLGFRLAQRPADADHPYGHARYEYLSGLAVAVLILVIGVELVKASIGKIFQPKVMEVSAVTLVVLACSIGMKLWMSRFFADLGKQIHSGTLQATSVDSRNDVIATLAVLAGCLVQRFWGVNVDGYIGLAVALFILYSGVNMVKETVSPLLGQQADAELIGQLSALVLSNEKVLGIHDLLVHDYGPGQCFASVHAELSAGENVLESHEIIDALEQEARTKLNVHLVIHYDPVTVDDKEWSMLRHTVEEIVNSIDERLSMHDFRLVRQLGKTTLVFELAVPFSMTGQYDEIRQKIEDALRNEKIDYPAEIFFEGKA